MNNYCQLCACSFQRTRVMGGLSLAARSYDSFQVVQSCLLLSNLYLPCLKVVMVLEVIIPRANCKHWLPELDTRHRHTRLPNYQIINSEPQSNLMECSLLDIRATTKSLRRKMQRLRLCSGWLEGLRRVMRTSIACLCCWNRTRTNSTEEYKTKHEEAKQQLHI